MNESFTFLRALTALVVALYIGAAIYALVVKMVSWPDFAGAVGPMAGMLVGYWVRGEK